jgi:putative oxidoreductase
VILGFDLVPDAGNLWTGLLLQRLFATFPEGWPGTGLLLVRAVAAIPVVLQGIERLLTAPLRTQGITLGTLELAAACFAVLLLVGLWTPVSGVLMAVAELCLVLSHVSDPWMHVQLGALGAALAMLGPGAWSVDAHLFGRKRIEISGQ